MIVSILCCTISIFSLSSFLKFFPHDYLLAQQIDPRRVYVILEGSRRYRSAPFSKSGKKSRGVKEMETGMMFSETKGGFVRPSLNLSHTLLALCGVQLL